MNTKTLLLVDDEPNILASLKRLLRRDGYHILTANSGAEGLELLKSNHVDVIVSDQRMPQMMGTEFLKQVKQTYPDTVRLVLSGYTDLQSITDAINEGAIYKFLTKPWEDEQLLRTIKEAFIYKEAMDEDHQIALQTLQKNDELQKANDQLDALLKDKHALFESEETSLEIMHEIFQHLPMPIIGIDDTDIIVLTNGPVQTLLHDQAPLQRFNTLLGEHIAHLHPRLAREQRDAFLAEMQSNEQAAIHIGEKTFRASAISIGPKSHAVSSLICLYLME
jgi:CheY-like chemotaxis protein